MFKWSECESRSVMSDSLWPHGLYTPWNFAGQNTGVGSLSLLQGIFPAQRSNPGLPNSRWILYQLSHKGSPRILEWVACSFSSGSSQPRNPTWVSCTAGRFFANQATREAQSPWLCLMAELLFCLLWQFSFLSACSHFSCEMYSLELREAWESKGFLQTEGKQRTCYVFP